MVGKFNYETMNDQQRMELMLQDVGNKDDFLDNDGEFIKVCKGPGVNCDENGNVISVKWDL